MKDYKVGEYIIYTNGDRFEIGRIKSLKNDGAFVCYHEGETAAKTPYDCIHKLINGFTITDTTLGGEVWNAVSGINRLNDCPLKSIEGLIEEIEHHRMKTVPIDKYDLVGDCINIIKEYCEVDKDGIGN